MEKEVQLRPAIESDLDQIREIMNDAVLNTTAIYDYHPRDAAYVLRWWDQLKKQRMPVLAAVQDGQCIGYGTYSIFRPKDGYKYCVEHSIYMDRNYRGRGVGKRLLKALIETATASGFHTMIAGIDADNKDSIRFHEKFGFIQVGYLTEVGYKFDRWLDLVFMQLTLAPTGGDPVNRS